MLGRHHWLFRGRCSFEKGIDPAIGAFQLLKEQYTDAEFHIFGGNSQWGDELPHAWPRHWLDEAGYPNWQRIERELPGVKYCGEATPAQLAEALQGASLLVMPSRLHETFGLVSVEAQACGTLPVLPNRGGFPETMQEGVTGYLVADNTAAALAEKISWLWKQSLPTDEQRLYAAAWVQQEFSWQKTGEEFVRVLAGISSQPRPPYLENRFWETIARWTATARNAYSQTRSPLLRTTIRITLKFIRSVSRKVAFRQ